MVKKQINWLKVLRVVLAILFFSPILLFFVDITNKLPQQLHGLLHIQLIPAILSGMVIGTSVLILLTWLFGRIYCSVICPAGVLQDIINRVFCIGKKKKSGVYRFHYRKPFNWLRYVLLAIVGGLAIFGWTELCLLLDPYSNFGRIAANLFRPVIIWGNNLLATALNSMGNFSFYHITISNITASALITAGVAMVVFIIMVVWRGRLFCNTLCPVGGLLSVFSRFSLFRISIFKDSCTQCRACERACKAEAINIKDRSVDMSRCVDCFNCLSTCKKDAIKFKPFFLKDKLATETVKSSAPENDSRRTFIATGVTLAASLPIAALNARQNAISEDKIDNLLPVTPPGSINLERFKEKCTACHLCITKCPSHVLRPAGLEYGFRYLLKPRMAYIDSYCNYECTVCSEVCPTKAIVTITPEEKKTVQVGIAKFYQERCIVYTEENDCGACSEHCPTQAVHMVPYKGTLTIPKVEPELCVGCGGCESICPVRPDRAIIIIANKEHQQAEKPKEEEKIKVDVDEFGF